LVIYGVVNKVKGVARIVAERISLSAGPLENSQIERNAVHVVIGHVV
jgi:hypothetical protein